MSATANPATNKQNTPEAVPAWFTAGLLGLVVGGGATFLGMHFYGYQLNTAAKVAPVSPGGGGPGGGPGGGSGGPGGGGAGGPGGGMGGGMMGGGPGGGGGGGAAQAKRELTSFVGKLDLLSQGVRVELSATQSNELAEKLASLEKAEKMTSDEAKANFEALEAILSDEQKATLAKIELARPPRAAGGGPGAPTMGGPGAPEDLNPFQQDPNQQRLQDLLSRLQASSPEPRNEN